MTDEDNKLLESLGLQNLSDPQKKAVLAEIDEKMTQRYIANLLQSMDPARAKELETEVEKMGTDDPKRIVEKIIEMSPNSAKVLQDSAKQIVEEFRKNRKPPVETAQADIADKINEPTASTSAPIETNVSGDSQQPNSSDQRPSDQPSAISPQPPETNGSDPFADANIPAEQPKPDAIPKDDAPLPVPQQESSSPFGDEIKIVQDEEPETKKADVPVTEKADNQPSSSDNPATGDQQPNDQPPATNPQPQESPSSDSNDYYKP